MKVLVNGYSESGPYHEITDIPFELQDACIDAITHGGSGVDVYDFLLTEQGNCQQESCFVGQDFP